jgi:tetraacyldisaccharide 4'-kinase
MALWLMNYFFQQDIIPAYLSRGYGRNTTGFRIVDSEKDSVATVGDEALMIAKRNKKYLVAVCENRAAGIRKLMETQQFDCVILDDAFQHRQVGRQLDILMIDVTKPPWEDKLLPLGRLREPIGSINRADVVVFNKIESDSNLSKLKSKVKNSSICVAGLKPICFRSLFSDKRLTITELFRKPVIAFSGIGNNKNFHATLDKMNVNLVQMHNFPDHHNYTKRNFDRIKKNYKRYISKSLFTDELLIVTTEKDAVRLSGNEWFHESMQAYPIYFLEVEFEIIEGRSLLEKAVNSALEQYANIRTNK